MLSGRRVAKTGLAGQDVYQGEQSEKAVGVWLGCGRSGSSKHGMPQAVSSCRDHLQAFKAQRTVSGRPQRYPDRQPLPSS